MQRYVEIINAIQGARNRLGKSGPYSDSDWHSARKQESLLKFVRRIFRSDNRQITTGGMAGHALLVEILFASRGVPGQNIRRLAGVAIVGRIFDTIFQELREVGKLGLCEIGFVVGEPPQAGP